MKIHIITIGKPRLTYAVLGWDEYFKRLERVHKLKVSRISDKLSIPDQEKQILLKMQKSYTVALDIEGEMLDSIEFAAFLQKRETEDREICFIIGGPTGLPSSVIQASSFRLSLSKLTYPHDLAMVILLESIYRATTINSNYPYHK